MRQLETLESRQLLTAVTGGQFAMFAVNVDQPGTYAVDVYQSPQQFDAGSVTNLPLGAVDPTVPVVVHLAGTPALTTGWTLAASWTLSLDVGRTLVRVNTAFFTSTTPLRAPTAPSNLRVTVQDTGGVALQWTDNSFSETGFAVQRQTAGAGGAGAWSLVATTSPNVTMMADMSTQPGVQYFYRVVAVNSAGYSTESNVANATAAAPPAAPDNLGLTILSSTSVQLSWSDNSSNETGFQIERRTGPAGSWSLLTTVAASQEAVASYTDVTTWPATLYSYRVTAINAMGPSGLSNVASVTTPEALGVWSNHALASQSGAFTATFDALPVAGASDNVIGLSSGPAGQYADLAVIVRFNSDGMIDARNGGAYAAGAALAYTAGTSYHFRLEVNVPQHTYDVYVTPLGGAEVLLAQGYAFRTEQSGVASLGNWSYFSDAGGAAIANFTLTPQVINAPAAPSNLALSVQSATSIALTWTDNSTNETGFKIERKAGSGSWGLLTTVAAGSTGYTDTSVAASTTYSYRVSATNSAGSSSVTNVVTGTTPAILPAAPSGLVLAVQSSTAIALSWTDNASNETGFQIERKTGSGAWGLLTTTAANTGGGTTGYTDSTVAQSTTYSYRVSAVNANGASAVSNVATDSTPATPPAAPSNLVLTVQSSTSILLTWTDNASNETSFQIQRQTSGSGVWVVVTSTAANAAGGATSYTDTGLQAGTTYAYRVLAANSGGYSAESNVASAATPAPPIAPSNLGLTVLSSSSIQLAWTDNSTNETGFLIERKTGSGSWGSLTTTAANATGYTDATVLASTQYSYRVTAVSAAGASAASNVATATTLIVLPAAPGTLTLTVQSSNAIGLTWVDNSDNETGFKIERQAGDGTGGSWTVVTTTEPDVTSYSDATAQPSTQYAYRVSAVNSAGPSATTNIVSGTTPSAVILTPGTLTPGNWPATPQPAVMGDPLAARYTQAENAIARWDVVPYQTFNGNFNVGVVAFHSSGIDHVAFSVNGGPWSNVTQMTTNPQTANTSGVGVDYDASGKGTYAGGVVEYWATLRAGDFAADGQVEVRAIAYPKVGVPRVLDSLVLNVNGHGTLPALSLYVSPTGSDATGDGSVNNPFATINFALQSHGNNSIDDMTVYLAAGTYQLRDTVWPQPQNSTGWVTVTSAPGSSRSDVIVTGKATGQSSSAIFLNLIHWKNLTFNTPTLNDQNALFNGGSNTSIWIDGCVIVGPGRTVDGNWVASGLADIYIIDSDISNCKEGIPGKIIRNVSVHHTGQGGCGASHDALVVNYSVTDTESIVDGVDTGFHAHAFQFYENNVGVVMGNAVLYGVFSTSGGLDGGGMGLLIGGASIKDLAIVNCKFNNQLSANDAAAFADASPTTNLYISNSSFNGAAFWRDDLGFSATDVMVESSMFSVPLNTVLGVSTK